MTEQPETIAFSSASSAQARQAGAGAGSLSALGRAEAGPSYVVTLLESRYLILATVLFTMALTVTYALVAAPTWESEAILQIEQRNRTIAGLEDLLVLTAEQSLADTEIELIRSRSLLGAVVDEFKLEIEARPRTFPLIGDAMARRYSGEGVAPARLGLRSYAWGGEQIAVDHLDLPDWLAGQWLELVALGQSEFALLGPAGQCLVSGKSGATAKGPSGSSIHVSRLVARPGTHFRVRLRKRDAVIDELKARVRVTERGRRTGIIAISLTGPDRALVPAILDAMARFYLSQSVQRKSAEAAKMLELIEEQLAPLKTRLDLAEGVLGAFREQKGTVDLPTETQKLLDRTTEIDRALFELDLQFSDLGGRFTGEHPLIAAARQKADKLREERAALAAKVKSVPAQEIKSARLARDAKSLGELYSLLLNKVQELRVAKSGALGNARIVDAATYPQSPTGPTALLSCILGGALGLAGGIALAFVRGSLLRGVDDPEEIESLTGLPVYAVVPHSARQAGLARAGSHPAAPSAVLALVHPAEDAVESLRSLRTNLQVALTELHNNVVAVVGPAPGAGRSFLCCNLAHVLAAAGQRVLLVDGDLRRGGLHRSFGLECVPGLGDVLSGTATLATSVRPTPEPNLDVLPCGTRRPDPAEWLASARLAQVLDQAAKSYDVVLVDTPSAAVSDAVLIARHAGVNLLLLRPGEHSAREILVALKHLRYGGAEYSGVVLNDGLIGSSRFGKYGQYGYHRYRFRHEP